MEKINSYVAGVSHRNDDKSSRLAILRQNARVGRQVYLEPEPTNKYDKYAIRLFLDTKAGRQQIGYVSTDPAEMNAPPLNMDLVHSLKNGRTITCLITKIMVLETEHPAIHLEYRVYSPDETPEPISAPSKGIPITWLLIVLAALCVLIFLIIVTSL
jgi:hypothetical protein